MGKTLLRPLTDLLAGRRTAGSGGSGGSSKGGGEVSESKTSKVGASVGGARVRVR